jgi:hypothetical protein
MTQNTGFVVGTALSLGIVTTWLPTAEKHEAYAGTLSRLGAHSLSELTHGYHVAFLVLAATSAVGMVASLLRGSQTVVSADAVGEAL